MHTSRMFAWALSTLFPHATPTNAAPAASFPSQNPVYSLMPWIQQHQTAPTLPASSLPAPASGLSLKYVALGMGTQNYSCPSTTSAPVAGGAMAYLYDATQLVSTQGVIGSFSNNNLACMADQTNNNLGLPQLGVHYFNGGGAPTFDLSRAGKGEWLSAAKVAAAAAPSDACAGRSGDAAVPWLFLQQDGSGRSSGLSAVYRVATAGGTGASCAGASGGWATRDYAALYWFYG